MTEHVIPRFRASPQDVFGGRLEPREIEVLATLWEGLVNKQVADRLGISEQTVKNHLSAIFIKLGVDNRTAACRVGIEKGLIPCPHGKLAYSIERLRRIAFEFGKVHERLEELIEGAEHE